MQTVKASEFKAKCLTLMDEVAGTGKNLLVTKNGKPVAELRPHRAPTRKVSGIWKDKLLIKGDIVSLADADWEALR